MEILGWAGTMLVVAAYYPQIRHLWVEKCAWGISILTWVIWLIAGALLLVYALLRQDALFVVVQSINIVAIAITIILARRSDQICPYHAAIAQKRTAGCCGEVGSEVVQLSKQLKL